MGTWGVKVFENDIAADVRSEYRDLVAEGLDGALATDRLLASYAGGVEDPDEGSDFWIALAVAQFEVGRLEDRIRDRALAHIDDGTDVSRFVGKDRGRREKVLDQVREQLTGPHKDPKRIRKRQKSICPYQVGDVLEVTLRDERRILLCVQSVHEDKGGAYAWVAVFDWHDGERIPSRRRLRRRRLAMSPWPGQFNRKDQALGFTLIASAKKDRERLQDSVRKVAALGEPAEAMGLRISMYVIPWTDLERWFQDGKVRSSPEKRS